MLTSIIVFMLFPKRKRNLLRLPISVDSVISTGGNISLRSIGLAFPCRLGSSYDTMPCSLLSLLSCCFLSARETFCAYLFQLILSLAQERTSLGPLVWPSDHVRKPCFEQ